MSERASQLRGDHAVAARGKLSLDREKAREKLRMFRLPDPHFYVLQFVRAASALGAKSIEFVFGVGSMSCTFDERLPVERFDDFWSIAFDDRRTATDIAMHHIALGVGSAQALNPAEIRIQSGRSTIVLTEHDEQILDLPDTGRTTITVSEKFRFGHVLDFFTAHAEAQALKTYCSWATMKIWVDGHCLQDGLGGTYETRFEAPDEDGFLCLLPDRASTAFAFLRDDVLVRVHRADTLLRPARGVLNSHVLQTDLSGLELAPSEMLDQLLYDRLYGAYHASLLRWLADNRPRADLVLFGFDLLAHLKKLNVMGIVAPPKTWELLTWWMSQPLFAAATRDERPRVSVEDAKLHGVISYSQTAHPTVDVANRAVLLADTPELRTLLRELDAVGQRTIDYGPKLADIERSHRNKKIWEQQPRMTEPVWPVQRRAKRGDARAWLYVPITPDGYIDESEVGLSIHIDGRLIRRTPIVLPLGIVLDGDLTPNDAFADVLRDARFAALADVLASQLHGLLVSLARYDVDRQHRPGTNFLHQLLSRAMRGDLTFDLLAAVGYPRAESERTGVAYEPSRDAPLEEVLSWLAELSEIPMFMTATGERISPDQLLTMNAPILLRRPQLPPVGAQQNDVLARTILVDRFEEITIRRLRPDARDGTEVLERLAAKTTFMEGALHEPDLTPTLRSQRSRVLVEEHALLLEVHLLGDGNVCDAQFIYRGRPLATREWTSPGGRFRAVLRSDNFQPTKDYLDVVEDALYLMAQQWTSSLMSDVLREWGDVARGHDRYDTDALQLLWRTSAHLASDDAASPVLPALRRVQGEWRRTAVALGEVRAQIAADGGIVRVLRGNRRQPPSEGHEGDILLLVPTTTDNLRKLVPTARVVNAASKIPVREAMDRFYARRTADPNPHGAVLTWRGASEGVHVQVGIFPDHSGGTASPANRIDVLHEGRMLERIVESVPFGRFRTVATGPEIEPDPEYEFVASGRGELLRAAHAGAAELVRSACKHFANRRNGALGALEPLRTDLMRFLAICHVLEPQPPFDLAGLLQLTPMFDMVGGGRCSFADLLELSVEGVVPYTHTHSRARAVLVAEHEIRLVAAALGAGLKLKPAASLSYLHANGPSDRLVRPRFHTDFVLDSIAAVLVSARGAQRDLFDDRLAYSLRWSTDERLCVVDDSGVRIAETHPLVEQCRRHPSDVIRQKFLASVVHTQVNRQASQNDDGEEIELIARLLS